MDYYDALSVASFPNSANIGLKWEHESDWEVDTRVPRRFRGCCGRQPYNPKTLDRSLCERGISSTMSASPVDYVKNNASDGKRVIRLVYTCGRNWKERYSVAKTDTRAPLAWLLGTEGLGVIVRASGGARIIDGFYNHFWR